MNKQSVNHLVTELETKKASVCFNSRIPPCPEAMILAAYNEYIFSIICQLINIYEYIHESFFSVMWRFDSMATPGFQELFESRIKKNYVRRN